MTEEEYAEARYVIAKNQYELFDAQASRFTFDHLLRVDAGCVTMYLDDAEATLDALALNGLKVVAAL